jgi:hypothetical protein
LKFEGFNELVPDKLIALIDDNEEYIKTLLHAMTGSPSIPLLGFKEELTIVLGDGYRKLPYDIHTCSNKLEINKEFYRKFINDIQPEKDRFIEAFSLDYLTFIKNLFNTL